MSYLSIAYLFRPALICSPNLIKYCLQFVVVQTYGRDTYIYGISNTKLSFSTSALFNIISFFEVPSGSDLRRAEFAASKFIVKLSHLRGS